MLRRLPAILILALAVGSVLGCDRIPHQVLNRRRDFLYIKSDVEGAYHAAGAAWARLITRHTPMIGVNSTSPATENEKIGMLVDHRIHVAFLKGPEASLAYGGDPAYWREPQPVRALFALWPAVYNLIAWKDSGIRRIEDIRGRRIAIYSDRSVTGDLLLALLDRYGITGENTVIYRVRESIGINMLRRREVDAVWYRLGYMESWFIQWPTTDEPLLLDTNQFALIPCEPGEPLKEFLMEYPYFYLDRFGREYGFEDSLQLMAASFAASAEDLPDKLAYDLTRLWWENQDFVRQYIRQPLARIEMADNRSGVPIPFHEGALRYLREAGLVPSP